MRARSLPPESRLLTTVDDGVAGLRFIEAVLASSAAHAQIRRWVRGGYERFVDAVRCGGALL